MLTDDADKILAGETVPVISSKHRFQWEEVQGCHVVLYAEGMVKLSPSAAEILKLCDGKNTVTGLIRELQSKYSEGDFENDVNRFLKVAHENGWIQYE